MAPIRCGRERFGNISINGLAYAGSLFVRDAEELRLVAEAGPMGVLKAVSLRDDDSAERP